MKRNIIKGILAACFAASILASCKPTENNYRRAYEAARQKREKESADPDMVLPAGGLQQVDGPTVNKVHGTDIPYNIEPLRYVNKSGKETAINKEESAESRVIPRFSVCVGKYKMPTNARSQAADLELKGYRTMVAETRDGYFLTLIIGDSKSSAGSSDGGFTSAEEAAVFAIAYAKKQAAAAFVGLAVGPVVIERR